MIRALVAGLALGCSAAPRDAHVANRASEPAITVRMAHEDEFVSTPTRGDLHTGFGSACPVAGEPARELFEPVVAFARANLLGSDVRGEVVTRLELPGKPAPPSRRGLEITVEPRSEVGELQVADWWDVGGASTLYCLHVVREPGRVIVVVRQRWSITS